MSILKMALVSIIWTVALSGGGMKASLRDLGVKIEAPTLHRYEASGLFRCWASGHWDTDPNSYSGHMSYGRLRHSALLDTEEIVTVRVIPRRSKGHQ